MVCIILATNLEIFILQIFNLEISILQISNLEPVLFVICPNHSGSLLRGCLARFEGDVCLYVQKPHQSGRNPHDS